MIGFATDEITLDEFAILEELESKDIEYELINLNNFLLRSPNSLYESVDSDVIINRATSSNAREVYSEFFEKAGIRVLNQFGMEQVCNSKLRTKIALEESGIKTVEYVLINRFPIFRPNPNKKYVLSREVAKEVEEKIIGEFVKAVVKPIGGSRGKSILPIRSRGDFLKECMKTYMEYREMGILRNFNLYQNVNNPYGIYAERFIPHALDLRVPASWRKGEVEVFDPLIRTVMSDRIVAKNTALGALSVGIDLSQECEKSTKKSIDAIVDFVERSGCTVEGLVCGMDIIPICESLKERQAVYNAVVEVAPLWEEHVFPLKRLVNKILERYARFVRRPRSKYDIEEVYQILKVELKRPLENMDQGYEKLRLSKEYENLQNVVAEHLEKCLLLPNELNLRPDFRFNTHNLAMAEFPSSYAEMTLRMIS
jgi:hypothetical protein